MGDILSAVAIAALVLAIIVVTAVVTNLRRIREGKPPMRDHLDPGQGPSDPSTSGGGGG